jgi:hypothetical protein
MTDVLPQKQMDGLDAFWAIHCSRKPRSDLWMAKSLNTFATMKGKRNMNGIRLYGQPCALGTLAALFCLVFSSCVYEVPITAKPTRKVDERLLGNWTSKDGKNKMKVVRLDASHYIVSGNGELYLAYHSDVAKLPLFTAQILDSPTPKYSYWAWRLADDGTLSGKIVSDKVIPDETKDSATVRKLLEANLQNPALFEEETHYTKDK